MSEAQRYTYEVDDGVFAECVLGEDYDAGQSELAALREELEQANGALSIANETIGKFADSLTAAEQRNAELVELLRDVSKQAGDHHASHQSWNLKTQLANIHQKIDAALKPTESGASE